MHRGIRILLQAEMWAGLALGMIGPIYAIFVERIGGDLLDAGWAFFAYMITAGVVMYLIGKWENKDKHKKKFIVAGYSLYSLGCLAYVFVYNQASLVITQVILGLGEAVLSPAWDTLYATFIDHGQETTEWGEWEALHYVVTAIAAVIGSLIATRYGFKVLFITMFIICLFSVVSCVWIFKDKKYLMKG